jgi:hypothetical protein
VDYGDIRLPVVTAEGLFGFKIQAFSDDPRRLQDLVDMLELARANGRRLNRDEVGGYFAMFGREDLFDELKRAADANRDRVAAGDCARARQAPAGNAARPGRAFRTAERDPPA